MTTMIRQQVQIGTVDHGESLWDWPLQCNDDGIVQLHNDGDKFEVALDCKNFTQKEIDLMVIGDEVAISCRHEKKAGEIGTIAREVHRAYHLPPDVDPKTVKSVLTQNGVLVITASKK